MIILWEEQLVWCGEYKTSQECETALASQYQTLFLVFVFSKFCLLIFSPFCQMFEGSWLPKVSHCVQVLKCHSLTNSLSDQKPGPSSDLYACCNFVFVFVFVFVMMSRERLGPRQCLLCACWSHRQQVGGARDGQILAGQFSSAIPLFHFSSQTCVLSFLPKPWPIVISKKLDVRDIGFLVSYYRGRCKLSFKFKLKLELSHYVHV